MAVKQFSSETSQCSETLKYNITKILEYIEGIDLDFGLETNLLEVCKRIVDLLGNFQRRLIYWTPINTQRWATGAVSKSNLLTT